MEGNSKDAEPDYERMFIDRYSDKDLEYQEFYRHPPDPPPIVTDWASRSRGHQRQRFSGRGKLGIGETSKGTGLHTRAKKALISMQVAHHTEDLSRTTVTRFQEFFNPPLKLLAQPHHSELASLVPPLVASCCRVHRFKTDPFPLSALLCPLRAFCSSLVELALFFHHDPIACALRRD